ncbi:MAG: hypothetical protein R3F11_09855 [Verrucomicrobiales bacterium]
MTVDLAFGRGNLLPAVVEYLDGEFPALLSLKITITDFNRTRSSSGCKEARA